MMATRERQFDSKAREKQRGVAAIEFALVFVIFFLVLYGIISYGVVFAIQHSLTHAANEGARAAVADAANMGERVTRATLTANNAVAWLGTRAPAPAITFPPCPNIGFTCIRVSLTYNYAANPIVPPIAGLGLVLPASLSAQATVQFVP